MGKVGGVEVVEPVIAPASELSALELTMLVTKEDNCELGPVVGKGALLDGLRVPLRSPPVDEAEKPVGVEEFVAGTGVSDEEEKGRLETPVPMGEIRVPLRPPEVVLALKVEAGPVVNGIVRVVTKVSVREELRWMVT